MRGEHSAAGCGGRWAGATARAALVLLAGAACVAHVPGARERVEFLEPSSVGAIVTPGQHFEADLGLHLVLWNGLDAPGLWREGGVTTSGSLSLLLALRVFDAPSAPVRTPTYEPRFMLQVLKVAPLGRAAAGDGPVPPRSVGIFALEAILGHRSNGQDGCALADHGPPVGRNDFDCAPLTDPPSTALNLENGSFTTVYLGANLAARLLRAHPDGGPVAGALTAVGGVEWHPPGSQPFMPREMSERHGPLVARGLLSGEWLILRDRSVALPAVGPVRIDTGLAATVTGNVHLGAAGGPFGGGSAELALLPRHPSGYGFGPFARYVFGRDPLNIRFVRDLDAWMFGVVLVPAALERLGGDGVE